MKVLLAGVAVLAFPLLSTGPAFSEEPEHSSPTFRSGTELVALAVTVVDESKQHLAGLSAADFIVLEDGVEQPLSYFASSATPIDLLILVDASASMGDKMPVVRGAVRGLTRGLRPQDRAAVVEFHETVHYRQPMTNKRHAIEAAIDSLTPQGGTAMYNALYVSLSGLTPADSLRRQALVILSDGDDTASLVGYDDVLEKARRAGVAIYAVALRSAPPPGRVGKAREQPAVRGEYALRMLARETGGASFFVSAADELPGVYQVIGEELGRQYVLGYTSRNTAHDGTWRTVIVRLPSHPRAQLRARTGYYADDRRSAALIPFGIEGIGSR